jgi:hypothetical protein
VSHVLYPQHSTVASSLLNLLFLFLFPFPEPFMKGLTSLQSSVLRPLTYSN